MDHHLGGGTADGRANTCNGYGQKTVLTHTGRLTLDIPRARQGTFHPQLIAKHLRRFPGFDEKIVSMFARGMSVREIQGVACKGSAGISPWKAGGGRIRKLYGLDVSPDLVRAVNDATAEEVALWQNRRLSWSTRSCSSTPFKIRDEGWCVTRPFISPLASGPTEPRTF